MMYTDRMRALRACLAFVAILALGQTALAAEDDRFDLSSAKAFVKSWAQAKEGLADKEQKALRHAVLRTFWARDDDVEDFMDGRLDGVDRLISGDHFYDMLEDVEDKPRRSKLMVAQSIVHGGAVVEMAFEDKNAGQLIEAHLAREREYLKTQLDQIDELLDKHMAAAGKLAGGEAAGFDVEAKLDAALSTFKVSDTKLIWSSKPVVATGQALIRPDTLAFKITNTGERPVKRVHFRLRLHEEGRENPAVDETFMHRVHGNLKPGKTRELALDVSTTDWSDRLSAGPSAKEVSKSDAYQPYPADAESYERLRVVRYEPQLTLKDVRFVDGMLMSAEVRARRRKKVFEQKMQDLDRKLQLREQQRIVEALSAVKEQFEQKLDFVESVRGGSMIGSKSDSAQPDAEK